MFWLAILPTAIPYRVSLSWRRSSRCSQGHNCSRWESSESTWRACIFAVCRNLHTLYAQILLTYEGAAHDVLYSIQSSLPNWKRIQVHCRGDRKRSRFRGWSVHTALSRSIRERVADTQSVVDHF